MIFITQVFSHPEIARPESIYNHRVVWRFLDAVVAVLPTCNFYTGETRLKAITQELRRQGRSSSHYYNADGIIFDDKLDLELGLLETSGPFNVDDPTRETNDFIKAAYRLMCHTLYQAYQFYARHKEYDKHYLEAQVGTEAARLDDLLNEIAEVKLTSRVTEVDDIYVYSSPLRPESPFCYELA
ncbi:hypothetical protein G6F46_007274 [Rhizopus delemar]|uniref:Uncharacterized protein n=2 Tax=Rhizopus TaxID=4842 RepID=A0A9P6YVN3_9FUNG|nr:hypothetical protein G6F55_006190 [Rhizopus delemar]KAG1542219.1 hypothetical protein G6F51_007412 [Rhizopus arrhizus]KAG1502535.1 hypothetical protein G6F54_002294 [Rhizopus delemar]KAG1517785.1 hypothetical protein G6F53_001103 [Rhizopus delemar]KAG1521087.1 hypothetical protein G6F52_007060 [Rhizopus delemar]